MPTCDKWCNKWTTADPHCSGCRQCTEAGCYQPRSLPDGLNGIREAGFDVAYGDVKAVTEGVLELHGNGRAYLVENAKQSHSRYLKLDLRGKALHFTADMSKVPCSVNAALYFVKMDGESPAGYCDIQTTPSCLEIDVFEANVGAIQATVHTQRGVGGDGTCNQWGCAVNWGNYELVRGDATNSERGTPNGQLYGHAARNGIDPRHPFEVVASVGRSGELSVRLMQAGRTVPFFNQTAGSNPVGAACADAGCDIRDPPRDAGPRGVPADATAASARAWAAGMTLVVSLWGDEGMNKWLDHECDHKLRGSVDWQYKDIW